MHLNRWCVFARSFREKTGFWVKRRASDAGGKAWNKRRQKRRKGFQDILDEQGYLPARTRCVIPPTTTLSRTTTMFLLFARKSLCLHTWASQGIATFIPSSARIGKLCAELLAEVTGCLKVKVSCWWLPLKGSPPLEAPKKEIPGKSRAISSEMPRSSRRKRSTNSSRPRPCRTGDQTNVSLVEKMGCVGSQGEQQRTPSLGVPKFSEKPQHSNLKGNKAWLPLP